MQALKEMKALKHMEAIFVAAALVGVGVSVATSETAPLQVAAERSPFIHDNIPVVTITAKRLAPADKAVTR
jgi:hypothetical protein